jgi:branched-chain amino acid transport system permease protein
MLQTFIQIVLVGLAVGAAYALVALGYTLIWNAVSLVNFAQGDLVMLGAFVSVGWLANRLGMPLWLNLVTMLVILGLFGVVLAWGIYHPLRNAPQLSAIVATLGLSMALQNIAVIIWGPQPLNFAGPLGTTSVHLFGSTIYAQYLVILAALAAMMAIQHVLFQHTALGRAMRATAQDAEAARLMGIPTARIIASIFAYATMLAALAGWLIAPLSYVSSDMGVNLSLRAFAATILGGFGSIPGALVGGLAFGVIESAGSFYISSEYIDVIAFGVLIAVLMFRPQGIFGELELERP